MLVTVKLETLCGSFNPSDETLKKREFRRCHRGLDGPFIYREVYEK